MQGSHTVNPAGMRNANRVHEGPPVRVPLPPSKPWPGMRAPTWVWWFYFLSCGTFIGVAGVYIYRNVMAQKERDAHARGLVDEQRKAEESARKAEDNRRKAAELTSKGYNAMLKQRRQELRDTCRQQGNVPLQFWDKFVCVKPEAVAWEQFDPPEQMQ